MQICVLGTSGAEVEVAALRRATQLTSWKRCRRKLPPPPWSSSARAARQPQSSEPPAPDCSAALCSSPHDMNHGGWLPAP